MDKIKVAMCDDVVYICEYFQSMFEDEENFEFVGMAHNEDDSIKMIQNTLPDVLLLDMQMNSAKSGLNLIPVIRKLSPLTKIIVVTVHEETQIIFRALNLGANDYILKSRPPEEVMTAVRNVYNNKLALHPYIAQKILYECEKLQNQKESLLFIINLLKKLTNTELDILNLIYNGQSYKEIAQKRFVEESTIRVQVSSILKKFNYNSMSKLIEMLKEQNMAEILNWE